MGMIFPWAGSYAPENFLFCAGQTLSIQQYAALYAVIGITYGGNGTSNFMLPNLCGRIPIGAGTSTPGGTYTAGEEGGQATLPMTIANLPPHSHTSTFTPSGSPTVNAVLMAGSGTGSTNNPTGNFLTNIVESGGTTDPVYAPKASAGTLGALGGLSAALSGSFGGSVTVGITGSGAPISTMPPFLGVNFIICVMGLFPPHP